MARSTEAEPITLEQSHKQTIKLLKKDLKQAAKELAAHEVRYLVDLYYQIQQYRMRAANQQRAALTPAEQEVADALKEEGIEASPDEATEPPAKPEVEPNALVSWVYDEFLEIEALIKSAMDSYTMSSTLGEWSRSHVGIGPVICAGLMAHIDIKKAPTVGHIWSFAGLNPLVKWGKGEKRPWNAKLKVLCWKAGESFVKQQNHKDDVYGKLYVARKQIEMAHNAAGDFKMQAEASLAAKKFGKDTQAFKHYTAGHLPPARIQLRSQRWAVKIFLSHWHAVAFFLANGRLGPQPYSIDHLKHAHVIPIPNPEMVPGLVDALKAAGRTA